MLRSLAFGLPASLLLAVLASAQNPRPPELIASGSLGHAVATAGDLSALLYADLGANELWLRTSDGRGVTWSAPVRIDATSTLDEDLSNGCLAIVGERVYASYGDARHGKQELFVRSYDAATATLSPEVRVSNGYAPGEAATFDWRIAAEAAPGGERVYFVLVVDVPTPNIDRLRFVASHDGGATFPIERQLTPGLADVDNGSFQVRAAGGVVHLAWSDNRHWSTARDLFYQRSTDGGLTFLPADVLLDATGPGVGNVLSLRMAAAPPIVAIGWNEHPSSLLDTRMHGIVSTDGGLTFGPDQIVDQAPQTSLSLSNLAVTADPDTGGVAVAWEDHRFGLLSKTELFIATTFDGGNTWSETQASSGGIVYLAPDDGPTPAADGRAWMSFAYAGYFDGRILSALSLDGGATWEAPVSMTGPPVAYLPAYGTFATNTLYGNRIHAWIEGELFDRDLKVGGYRVPTLELVSDDLGPSFHFELSEMGSASFGAVALSGSTGSLPVGFGDPRDLGLAVDALLLFSLNHAFGVLGASLTAGAGATPPIPGTLPPGLGIHAAAISFDVAGGVTVGEITDVQVLP